MLTTDSQSDTGLSPAVDWSDNTSQDASFVTVMIDLDASAQGQNLAPLLHWLSVSPSGQQEVEANVTAGSWVPYFGPQPPPGDGKHRYVLLQLGNPESAFAWPESFVDFNASRTEDRFNFDIEKFIVEGDFQLLSASWFTTENTTATSTSSTPAGTSGPTGSSSPTTTPVPGAGARASTWTYASVINGLIALGVAAL